MQEEILACAIIWIQSGDVRLREINCSQKDRYYVSLFMKYSVMKLPETRLMVAQDWREQETEFRSIRQVSALQGERLL